LVHAKTIRRRNDFVKFSGKANGLPDPLTRYTALW
jgi:hypothetical protein